MLVAEGAVDIAAEPHLETYDMAALSVVIEEAGGSFTGLDGVPGPNSNSALATNGRLHDLVLDFVGSKDARADAPKSGSVHDLSARRQKSDAVSPDPPKRSK
jgi:histidinol-phosphatase